VPKPRTRGNYEALRHLVIQALLTASKLAASKALDLTDRAYRHRGGFPSRCPFHGSDPIIGLGIALVILRITWQSWATVREHLTHTHISRSYRSARRGTYFTLPDGSELDLYSAGDFKLLIARRAPFASGFEHPHLVLPESEGSPEESVAQSFNGRLLITSEAKTPPGSEHELIAAVAVSAAGIPAPARTIEHQPASSTRYFAGAIGDRGEWLLASSPDDGGPLWLHPSSPSNYCRATRHTDSDEPPRSTTPAARSSPRAAAKTRAPRCTSSASEMAKPRGCERQSAPASHMRKGRRATFASQRRFCARSPHRAAARRKSGG
jgi:hypothetical protein